MIQREMKSKTISRLILVAILILIITPFTVFAQEDGVPEPAPVQPAPPAESQILPPQPQISPVSDEELRQFATAVESVQEIQIQTQEEIEGVIADSDLTRERFVEIFESTQVQGAEEPGDVSDSEQQEFDSIVETIANLQMQSQETMIQAIGDAGLELQRFNDILAAVQTDPALMERLRPHLPEQPS